MLNGKLYMKYLKMNKRLKWLDIAKGIGVLLVVLGHSEPYLDERIGGQF